jgi:hypothetical protein
MFKTKPQTRKLHGNTVLSLECERYLVLNCIKILLLSEVIFFSRVFYSLAKVNVCCIEIKKKKNNITTKPNIFNNI